MDGKSPTVGPDEGADSVTAVMLASAGALVTVWVDVSDVGGLEMGGGGVTASAICGRGVGSRFGSLSVTAGADFGACFVWTASREDDAPEAVTTSASSTGGLKVATDMIQRSAVRIPAISPRWTRQEAPKLSALQRVSRFSMGCNAPLESPREGPSVT